MREYTLGVSAEPLMPADETDPEALRKALLAHATELRRERTRRPSATPLNSLAILLLLGAGVAALLLSGGEDRPLEGMERRGAPAIQRPAQVRGLD